LYNKKNRLTNVKALFPISLLTSLKLNDRLIIRDKRYVINEMKVNLTTGDVDLSLINDFRAIANINIPIQSAAGGFIEIPVFLSNRETTVEIFFDDESNDYTESQLITLTLLANTTGEPKIKNVFRNGEIYATIYQDA
jgi:hypothetical protein